MRTLLLSLLLLVSVGCARRRVVIMEPAPLSMLPPTHFLAVPPLVTPAPPEPLNMFCNGNIQGDEVGEPIKCEPVVDCKDYPQPWREVYVLRCNVVD